MDETVSENENVTKASTEFSDETKTALLEEFEILLDKVDLDEEDVEVSLPSQEDLDLPDTTEIVAKVSDELEDYNGVSSNDESFELELNYLEDDKQEDKIWQARTGLNFDTLCGAVETVIFMSDRPISLAKIKTLIDEDLPLRVIHEALARLQEGYETAHHGIRLLEVAEGYQFRTKATYSKYVQDLFKVNSLVLSPTALEVLAIIAYKQPVSKVEVEKIRGVDSSHIVRGLIDKRLVKVAGRSEEVGKPVLYATTPEFLEVFNLQDISHLPPESELDEMAKTGVGKIADIKTLVHSGDKKRFSFDEIEELDSLSESIKKISSETDFTKSLKVEEKKRKTEEGVVVKSAFDLLEEFVSANQIALLNKEAAASEVFTAIVEPMVVKDLENGPFNAPEVFEEDDFQMIDLDTGEAIEMDDLEVELELDEDFPFEEAEQASAKLDEKNEGGPEDLRPLSSEEIEIVEEKAKDLFIENEDEIKSLAAALDSAFAKLTGSSLDDESELESGEEQISEAQQGIDIVTDKIVDEAESLDIDLSFMKNKESLPKNLTDSDE